MPSGTIYELYEDKQHTQQIFPVTSINAITNDEDVGVSKILEQKVPITRKVNGQPLSSDVSFGATQCRAVSYSSKQTFTEEQKDIIRYNVGAEQADANENFTQKQSYIQNSTHGVKTYNLENYDGPYQYEEPITIFFTKNRASWYLKEKWHERYFIEEGEYILQAFNEPDKDILIPGFHDKDSYTFQIGSKYKIVIERLDNKIEAYFYEWSTWEEYDRFTQTWHDVYGWSTMSGDQSFTLIRKIKIQCIDLPYLPIPMHEINQGIQDMSKAFGKQVYCKLLDCGQIPSKSYFDVQISHEDILPIQVNAYAINEATGESYSLPFMDPNISLANLITGNLTILFAYVRNNYLTVKSTFTQSDYKVYALVYYIFK